MVLPGSGITTTPALPSPGPSAGDASPSASTGGEVAGLRAAGGLRVRLFAADLAGARVLALDPDDADTLLVSLPRTGSVVALTDRDRDGRAERRTTVLSGLSLPHGLAFRAEGGGGRAGDARRLFLYVAEGHRVARYPYDSGRKAVGNPQHIVSLPLPRGHTTRSIRFDREGTDTWLYISVGSSVNVGVEEDRRRATVMRCRPDGSDFEVFASGLRNTVFFAFDPDGRLWGNDMGRDLLGDDLPPDELNIVREGRDYGWPYCYGRRVPDPFGGTPARCALTEAPVWEYPAHSAPLGLAFIESERWPADWRGDLVVAFHGSWNRSVPTGYKLVRLDVTSGDDSLAVRSQHDLITGWLRGGRAAGRPVDVVFGRAHNRHALYVSDDKAGVVYRVTPG